MTKPLAFMFKDDLVAAKGTNEINQIFARYSKIFRTQQEKDNWMLVSFEDDSVILFQEKEEAKLTIIPSFNMNDLREAGYLI